MTEPATVELFQVQYGRFVSEASEDLGVKSWVKQTLLDLDTGDLLKEVSYTLHLPDGSEVSGITDQEGMLEVTGIPWGKVRLDVKGYHNE